MKKHLLLLLTTTLLGTVITTGCSEKPVAINTAQPAGLYLPGNHLAFIDLEGDVVYRRPEINGWHFLEDNFRSALGKPEDNELNTVLAEFPQNGLAGWWPDEELKQGKQYFTGLPPMTLPFDADVTAWMLRRNDQLIDEKSLRVFLSGETLPELWQPACLAVSCELPQIIRVWADPDWHDELDIATTSSLLTVLDIHRSPLARRVFDQNSAMINHIITNHDHRRFMGYYEPRVSGTLLILFNHLESNNPFLNREAEARLRADLAEQIEELDTEAISSSWGAGEERIAGYRLVYQSERLPALMQEYAEALPPQ